MNLCFIAYRAAGLRGVIGADRIPSDPARTALGPADNYRLYPELSYPGHVSYWDPMPEEGFINRDHVEVFVAKQFLKFRNCLPIIPNHRTGFRFLFRGDEARQRNLTEHAVNRIIRAYPWMVNIFDEVVIIPAPSGLDDINASILVCHKAEDSPIPEPIAPMLNSLSISQTERDVEKETMKGNDSSHSSRTFVASTQ